MAEKGGLLPVEDARARILAALTPTAAETGPAASLIPRLEDVQRGMLSAMAGIEIPEGGRIVQTEATQSGYAIEMPDGRLIDPAGRQGRDVRDFAATTRRSAVLPVGQGGDHPGRRHSHPARLWLRRC